MSGYVKTLNQGPGAAPAAATPGRGAGNVPFAPGVMSGNLGGHPNQTPLARQTINPNQPRPTPEGPPPAAPTGAVPAPGAAPAPMQQPPNPAMWASFYLDWLDSYLQAIKDSANKPLIGGMY